MNVSFCYTKLLLLENALIEDCIRPLMVNKRLAPSGPETTASICCKSCIWLVGIFTGIFLVWN